VGNIEKIKIPKGKRRIKMREKKSNILFFGTIAFIAFMALSAIFSPVAREERKSSQEIKESLLEEGFTKVSDKDTWFIWTCDQSYISQNREVVSVATAIGDNMIGKCDTQGNEYYKLCPEGVVFSNYGEDDTCK